MAERGGRGVVDERSRSKSPRNSGGFINHARATARGEEGEEEKKKKGRTAQGDGNMACALA